MSETTDLTKEVNTDINERLASSARTRGIELDDQRLDELSLLAESQLGTGTDHNFASHGVRIRKPVLMMGRNGFKGMVSTIHFLPELSDTVVHKAAPNRARSSEIALEGMRGLQNYVLLADTGLIEPPVRFMNSTNPTMARVAQRIGFEPVPGNPSQFYADYSTVADAIFSEEILALQDKL